MESVFVNYYLNFFESLSLEMKLEVLAKLTESLRKGYQLPTPDKEQLLDEITGSWADVDDSIEEIIYSSRTISDRTIDFN